MLLKDYIPNLNKINKKIFFSGISFDSSKVKKNFIFFAIKGSNYDGNDFIKEAIKNGAKVIVSEEKFPKEKNDVVYLKVSNVRKLLSSVAYKIIGKKPKKLVAVTGTNGKTSVADFYYQILTANKKKVAAIGTIGIKFKNQKKISNTTTLDPIELSLVLKNLKKNKIDFVIMEASSHGLKQHRLDGLLFDIGIFTNFSHDHLDYHKNINNYLNSKLYLFKKLIKKKGSIISDTNIPQKNEIRKISFKNKLDLKLIFNKKSGVELISHKFENEKQILEIKFRSQKFKFKLNLIGKIQIKNLLMSILAAYKSGLKMKNIIRKIDKIKSVNGRLEKIGKIKNNSKVILDYAHTPEALDLALSSLKDQFPESNISLVFGCGGNRDSKKRFMMGRIADKYSTNIYLTNDNPRYENPSKIRIDIKKGIKNNKFYELPNRKEAIQKAVMSLNTGDLLLVAGRGHETLQDFGDKKLIFSDKKIILKSIKKKNRSLSTNLKLNIMNELSHSQIFFKKKINDISINSKTIKKGNVFFAIKGKKVNGNNFVLEAFTKGSNLMIVNDIKRKVPLSYQIKVKDTLKFLTKCSEVFRDNIDTKIISITGSCGKTTLKEMIGLTLKKISSTSYSPKSFNNKYGVPLSLFNLKQNDDYGVFEVGMDKKGEIEKLTKIIKPDLGIITNISYAHSKNFKNIKKIAEAKAEIINNIKQGGAIILNMDDKFYKYHRNLAYKKCLKVISFSLKNKNSKVRLISVKKIKRVYELQIYINGRKYYFYSNNKNENNLYNILATLASLNFFIDIKRIKRNTFLKFKTPEGRGDISRVKFKNKNIVIVDESYNSNPLSLKVAVENFDNIKLKKSKKYLILGDMLELGKHSVKQHRLISKIINKTKINKVYVYGKYIKETFRGLNTNKKAKILDDKSKILELVNKVFRNNDHIMIKGSNSTGLNEITNKLKERNLNAL